VYCANEGAVTADHVPPRCLFPPSTRLNLITVKACPACHAEFKLDDEYLRVVLSVRADLPDCPESDFLREQTQRALRAPKATGFRAAIRASLTKVAMHSSGGIYLGHAPAFRVDASRIASTAERIVKGLYASYFKRVLPSTHEVSVSLIDLQRDASAIQNPEVQELFSLLGKNGTHRAFGRILQVWYAKTDDDQDSSFWLVRLHGAFVFLGFTLPKGDG
jgi:hypothetical protein